MPATPLAIRHQLRGVLLLLGIAILMGGNHVAARLAFDHGTGISLAVTVRASATALVVFLLLRATGSSLRLPRATLGRAIIVGLLVSVQSLCLYSAVARIPVALALLVFNTFPIVLGLLSWLTGGERPDLRALVAMPVALSGLAIALDAFGWSSDTTQLQASMLGGIAFAAAASLSFGTALMLTTRWLPTLDGRLRTMILMSVVGVVSLLVSVGRGGLQLPTDPTGWLGLVLLTILYGTAITGLFTLLPRLGAVNNAAILNFEPVAALLLGWIVLEQHIAPIQLAGGGIVIAAIIVLTTGRR
ncbi:MAG: DMT family transporter [Quisquiliibacterium sp.]